MTEGERQRILTALLGRGLTRANAELSLKLHASLMAKRPILRWFLAPMPALRLPPIPLEFLP